MFYSFDPRRHTSEIAYLIGGCIVQSQAALTKGKVVCIP